MPAISATAPGKIILFGEHAVVYGSRAIAIPVNQVQARAAIFPIIQAMPGTIHVLAKDIHLDRKMDELPPENPIRKAIQLTLDSLHIQKPPAMQIRISSTIPIAGGMGSGAAISVAIIRAVSTYLGQPLSSDRVSGIAFEIEKLHHGTPSGIDNTVITYESPVLFQKETGIQTFSTGSDLTFLILSTGIRSSTRKVVQAVRERWEASPEHYADIFANIDHLVGEALNSLKIGDQEMIGRWMIENHSLLQKIGVSCKELDELQGAVCAAGAFGAKLTGAGKGGNLIALVPADQASEIQIKMIQTGSKQTWITQLKANV